MFQLLHFYEISRVLSILYRIFKHAWCIVYFGILLFAYVKLFANCLVKLVSGCYFISQISYVFRHRMPSSANIFLNIMAIKMHILCHLKIKCYKTQTLKVVKQTKCHWKWVFVFLCGFLIVYRFHHALHMEFAFYVEAVHNITHYWT
jgi:hypothetical protein